LEAVRLELAEAQAQAASARSRNAMLDKAWAAALEVSAVLLRAGPACCCEIETLLCPVPPTPGPALWLAHQLWTTPATLQDAKAAQAERRELKAALAASERDAFALAVKLEAVQHASGELSTSSHFTGGDGEAAGAEECPAAHLAQDAASSVDGGNAADARSGRPRAQQGWGLPLWRQQA
jgi:hypothetical protein